MIYKKTKKIMKNNQTKKTAPWLEHDIKLNVGFEESIKREMVAIFVPWPFVLVNHNLVILAAPIMFYLFVSGLTRFCIIRYAWFHIVKHIPDPLSVTLLRNCEPSESRMISNLITENYITSKIKP